MRTTLHPAFVLVLTLIFSLPIQAQLIVDNTTFTNQQLVQDVLVGTGIQTSNVTFSGDPIQIGYFDGTGSNLGMNAGVMLATGDINVGVGPNNNDGAALPDFLCGFNYCDGDSDLDAIITPFTTFDAAVLEFDFVPLSDTVRFNYIFASEEYPEYVCSQFNDAFAFFLTGPNPSGAPYANQNIALVPNTTTAVAINSINPGVVGAFGVASECSGAAGSLAFPQYYVDNTGGTSLQFDGWTTTLEAVAEVTPCVEYHIKIAIADAGDGIFDSGVFLEAASFSSGILDVNVATINSDSTVVEGCNDSATVTFSLNEVTPVDYNIPYTLLGTATNGSDYEPIPGQLIIPAGSDSVTFDITPITDNLTEGVETVILEVQTSICSVDSFIVFISEEAPLDPPILNCGPSGLDNLSFEWDPVPGATGYTLTIGTDPPITVGPGTTSWSITGLSPGDTETIVVEPIGGLLFCSSNPSATQTCAATLCTVSANITAQTDVSCNNGNDGSATVTFTGGTPVSYQWSNGQTTQTASGLVAGIYNVTVIDNGGCPAITSVQIMEPSELILVNIAPTAASCNGESDGSAIATVTGGTLPYTYTWSNGGNAATNPGLSAGNYNLLVTDANGCIVNGSTTVTEPAAIIISNINSNPLLCNNDNTGSANVIASGGVGQLTYTWSDNQTGANVSGLSAGNYTVTVTDAIGCTEVGSISVTEPTALNITSLSSTDAACNGGNDGTASVSAAGGSGPYTYLWTPTNQTTQNATGLFAGAFTIQITDANGCVVSDVVNIAEGADLNITSVVAADVSCNGQGDGSIDIAASGGNGAIQYSIDNGVTFQSTGAFPNLGQGSYDILLVDINGCQAVSTAVVNEPTALVIDNISGNTVTCAGDTDGVASVSVSGGSGAYTYIWNDGQTTSIATGLTAGNFDVTITDANGCIIAGSTQITAPNSVAINSVSSTALLCNGDNTGTTTVAASGGTGNLSYLWSPSGQTTPTASGLAAGMYTVVVTDGNGCSVTDEVAVTEPVGISIDNVSETNISCFNQDDGSVNISASGGFGSLTYQWIPGNLTGPNISNLSPGSYTVNISDANGCSVSETVQITEPAPIVIDNITGTDISCNGFSDGTSFASASGGSGTLTYQWLPSGQSGQSATSIPAGTQTVVVTDSNGCSNTASVAVTEPSALSIDNINATPALCGGSNEGTASVSVSGGTGIYTYNWFPSAQTTDVATGLIAGNYTVTVTDANGCTAIDNVSVTEPIPVDAVSALSNATSCDGSSDGSASIAGTGGTVPYTYQWSSNAFNQTTATATGLSAGTYLVTVTDANGCSDIETVSVSEPAPVQLTINSSPVNCLGGNDGSASVVATGGSGNYTYQWNTGGTSATLNNLSAGNYTVNVFDDNNCTASINVAVSEPATAVTAIISSLPVDCNGDTNGSASVTPSGGTGSYTYQWDAAAGNQTTPTANGLGAGSYSVLVTDVNGCSAMLSTSISQPSALSISAAPQSTGCAGGNDGSASAVATGGTPNTAGNYTYQWSNGQIGPFATGLAGGSYSVIVTDINGCTAATNVTIQEPAPLITAILGTDVTCFGDSDGGVNVSVNGGVTPYVYDWSPNAGGQNSGNINNLPIGIFTVTVTDANGCSDVASVELDQATQIFLSATSVPVECFGEASGSATAAISGGQGPFTYQWSDANSQSGNTAYGLSAGNYNVSVIDANGCIEVETVSVEQPTAPFAFATIAEDVSCFGERDGRIELTGTGGTPIYQYSLDGINYQQSPIFIALNQGDYVIYAQDANGCTYESTASINEPAELIIDAGEDITIELGDSTQLGVTVNMPGDYTYAWSTFDPPGSLECEDCPTPYAQPQETSTYQVTVKNANGCADTDDVIVYVDKERNVFVPSGFTPNGDNINDIFMVHGDDKIEEILSFRVFDRWGEVVHEASNAEPNNPEYGWDGTLKDQKMNPGVFVWVAEIRFIDGYQDTYKGDVTLIR